MARQWSEERRSKNKAKIDAANARVCTSAREFQSALTQIADATYEDLWDGIFQITAQFCYAVADRTPHDTGRAKGSWQIGFEPNEATLPETFKGTPSEVISAISSRIGQIASQGHRPPVIYVSNNVAYIMQLEAGHSKQAPSGMIAVSLQEFTKKINDLVREEDAQ